MSSASNIDWVSLLSYLKSEGVTQVMAAEIVGSTQTTLSDLARGNTKEPGYSLGTRLLALRDLVEARK